VSLNILGACSAALTRGAAFFVLTAVDAQKTFKESFTMSFSWGSMWVAGGLKMQDDDHGHIIGDPESPQSGASRVRFPQISHRKEGF